jgi:hypothetical protein
MYSQLIQFKRLEERAFIFLNGRQLMFGVFGFFGGMAAANRLHVEGWFVWVACFIFCAAGVALGARYHGLYGYQYLKLLWQMVREPGMVTPQELYEFQVDEETAYVLGAADGGALVQIEHAGGGPRRRATNPDGSSVYRLRPIDLSQQPPRAIAGMLNRWGGFWAGVRPPLRLVIHSSPFYATEVVEETRSASMTVAERWRQEALSSYCRFLERLAGEAAMYQARHEALLWADSETEAQATISSLTGFTGVAATPGELTPLLEGEYEVNFDHLRPLNPHQPYIILLVSHEFSGEWSWADPLVALMRQSFPLSVVIDVERSLPTNRALIELVKSENVLLDVLANNKTGRDPKVEGALRDPISDNLGEQKSYQLSLYRLMLKQVDPTRHLTAQESGLLDAALTAVYDGLDARCIRRRCTCRAWSSCVTTCAAWARRRLRATCGSTLLRGVWARFITRPPTSTWPSRRT